MDASAQDPPPRAPLPEPPFLFVSYASVDRPAVRAVAEALSGTGLALWIDTADITGGSAYGAEIATAIKASAAVALMCTEASLASRNVRQEIMLAWRYGRPIIPLLLEPTAFPDDVAYWLEGAQWIEILDRPPVSWLADIGRALTRHGIELARPPIAAQPAGSAEVPVAVPGTDDPIIGREREIAELQTLLAHNRWITLIGPGGTGKTRLALELAARSAADFAGGTWFVDLSGLTKPADVAPAVAAVLTVEEQPGESVLDALARRIGSGRSLVVLDNVEHVHQSAEAIFGLTERCDGLTVLATSRIALKVPGEWVYRVGQLPLPDLDHLPSPGQLLQNAAVRLFVERARRARADFALSDGNARTIAEICHRLDGLPLAIELAAARVRLLPPNAILTRLGSRLSLLTRGSALDARRQTLRNAIGWSFDLLSPPEQAAFGRLAVFSGGASVDAAETIIAFGREPDEPALDVIDSLVDHSLVIAEQPAGEDSPRLRMLATIREFAAERLTGSGEEPAIRAAHASYFLDLAERLAPDLRRHGSSPALQSLRADDVNLRAALDWYAEQPAAEGAALRLATALIDYWRRLGRHAEARTRLSAAIARDPAAGPLERARALEGLGFVAGQQGDPDAAIQSLEQALYLRRSGGDDAGAAITSINLGEELLAVGRFDDARVRLNAALATRLALGDEIGAAEAQHQLGMAALYQGDLQTARGQFQAARDRYRTTADVKSLARVLNDLGVTGMLAGENAAAISHLDEAVTLARALDDRYLLTSTLVNNGRAHQLARRYDSARDLLKEALAHARELGQPNEISLALYGLGLVALATGDRALARASLTESLRLAHGVGAPWHVAERLEAIAGLRVTDNPRLAAALLGQAETIRQAHRIPAPPAEEDDLRRTRALAQAALGEDRFVATLRDGAALAVDRAVALALAGDRVATLESPAGGQPAASAESTVSVDGAVS